MITPNGGSFYGGSISQQNRRTNEVKVVRDSGIVDGVVCYAGADGKPVPYQTLFDLTGNNPNQFHINV